MKRTAITLLAILGLLAAACSSDDAGTEAGQQLDSDAAVDGDAQAEGSPTDGDAEDGDTDQGDTDQGDTDQGDTDQGDTGDADASQGSEDDDGSSDDADSSNGSSSAPQSLGSAVLGRALAQTDAMTSASFEGVITMVGLPDSDLPGEFSMTFTGAYDLAEDASMVTLDMGELFAAAAAADPDAAGETEGMEELFASMFEDPMEMITIGDTSWVKWGLLAMFGVDDKWLEGDASDESTTAGFGFGGQGDSPTAMLQELADADAEIEVVGQEDVRGTTTTHHRAELDMAAFADRMTPAEQADFEASLGASPDGTFVLDLWIDDDELLHRFQLTMGDLSAADVQEFDSLTMVYDIWAHGEDQGIIRPPADQIVTEEELGLSLDDLGGFSG